MGDVVLELDENNELAAPGSLTVAPPDSDLEHMSHFDDGLNVLTVGQTLTFSPSSK